MATKNRFIFNTDWLTNMRQCGLDAREKMEIIEATASYVLSGKVPEMTATAMHFFCFIRQELDFNDDRYNERKKRNAANGRKGGNPAFKKGQQNPYYSRQDSSSQEPASEAAEKDPVYEPRQESVETGTLPFEEEVVQEQPAKASEENRTDPKISQDNPRYPKITLNEYENDHENDHEDGKEFKKKTDSIESAQKETPTAIIADGSPPGQGPALRNSQAAEFMEFFNFSMDQAGALIPRIKSLRGRRRGLLSARIREYGPEGVREAILKASRSRFLNGGGGKGWRADIDWILRPDNFPKVLEGNYDDNLHNDPNASANEINGTIPAALGRGYPLSESELRMRRQQEGIRHVVDELDQEWRRRHGADPDGQGAAGDDAFNGFR